MVEPNRLHPWRTRTRTRITHGNYDAHSCMRKPAIPGTEADRYRMPVDGTSERRSRGHVSDSTQA